ncbi:InlB B-repeat-containing protein [Candidatus Saccharibacteria bacterium]|nr:InlB B-repeat-containing protein [Candidatus Saccharibacteria bacterium]
MKQKLISWIFGTALVSLMMSSGAFAADVGSFADLKTAIAGDETEITITSDFSFDENITVSREIVINGNNKVLSRAEGFSDTLFSVSSEGNLTINELIFDGGAPGWSMDFENGSHDGSGYFRVPLISSDSDILETNPLIVSAGELNVTSSTFRNIRNNSTDISKSGGAIRVSAGKTQINDTTFNHCASRRDGGALYVAGGEAVVKDSSFIGNAAGAGYEGQVHGGAVYVNGASNISIDNTLFQDNFAQHNGGAIMLQAKGSDIEVSNSTFTHNMNGNDGAAIALESTSTKHSIRITDSVFDGNQGLATKGQSMGTIWLDGWKNDVTMPAIFSNLTFLNNHTAHGSSFASYGTNAPYCIFDNIESYNNTANGMGGFFIQEGTYLISGANIHDNQSGNGGGIVAVGGNVVVDDSVIKNNTAGRGGGAMAIFGSLTIKNTEITNNHATSYGGGISAYSMYASYGNPELHLENVLIKDNSADNAGGGLAIQDTGTAHSTVTADDATKIYDNSAAVAADDVLYTHANSTAGANTTLDNIGIAGLLGIDGWYYDTADDRFKDTDDPTVFNDYVNNDGSVAFYIKAAGISNGDYDGNGGSTDALPVTIKYGEKFVVDDDIPVREGYTFVGWNTKADGSGTELKAGDEYDGSDGWTLYAQWEPNPSKIVYNANDGNGSTPNTEGVVDETVQVSDNGFTRDGYTFTGWNTKADGTGTNFDEGDDYLLTVDDLNLYAQWEANPAKLSYDANNGVGTMADTTGVTDQTVTVSDNGFTRDGYTFTGWNTKADGTGTDYDEAADYVLPAGNSVLYAKWQANPSKIVYNANSGTGSMNDTTGVVDQTVQVSDNGFTREGYTFTGWNTKADGTGDSYGAGDDYTLLPEQTTLYAQWQANPSKVTYDANGGTGSMNDTTGVVDQTVQISENTFTRDGYTFTGWDTKADDSGVDYAENADYTLTSENLTLYAQWRANPSKVTYDANGGTGSMSDTTGVVDQTVQVSDNGFTREGYTFTGWNTKTDGTGDSYAANDDFVLGVDQTTLYAQWQANPSKITYVANGGTGSMSDTTGVVDQTVQVSNNGFAREGYTFTGWNTKADGSGTDYGENANYALTPNDLTLYAQWQANPSKIVYNANGGTGSVNDTEGNVDETVQVAENVFTRDGYTFTGWNTKADGTGDSYGAGDDYTLLPEQTILYAQWQANPSKVTYNANGGAGSMIDTTGVVDQTVQIADNAFVRDGYTFTGWNTKADGSGVDYAEGVDYTLTPNTLELFAQWSANASKIIYNANGGTGTVNDTEGSVDQTVQIAENAFTRDGYTFTGWNTKADGTGDSYAANDDFVLGAEPAVLYAQWEAKPSKVSYAANDGAGSMDDTTGMVDQTVQISENEFTREGYTFVGWNTEADGSGVDYAENVDFSLLPSELILYAQWEANPSNIIYNANGGNGTMDNTQGVVDQTVQVSNNEFARDGYEFIGWNTEADGSGEEYVAADDYTLTPSDLTLYAQWKLIPVTPADGNEDKNPATADYGVAQFVGTIIAIAAGAFVAIKRYSRR